MATVEKVDSHALREEVKAKYRDVATDPHGDFHFHTGRALAKRLGYDNARVNSLPDVAVESFAGVGDPFSLRELQAGERVVDMGSGADFDCFIAAQMVGKQGAVVGIDMTDAFEVPLCRTSNATWARRVPRRSARKRAAG